MKDITATYHGRTALVITVLAPTDHRGKRVSIQRAETGRDPFRTVIGWDYELENGGNYRAAVLAYLDKAGDGWEGSYFIGATATGAVAVFGRCGA